VTKITVENAAKSYSSHKATLIASTILFKTTSKKSSNYGLRLELQTSCCVAAAAACACSRSCVESRQASSVHRPVASCSHRNVLSSSVHPALSSNKHFYKLLHIFTHTHRMTQYSKGCCVLPVHRWGCSSPILRPLSP